MNRFVASFLAVFSLAYVSSTPAQAGFGTDITSQLSGNSPLGDAVTAGKARLSKNMAKGKEQLRSQKKGIGSQATLKPAKGQGLLKGLKPAQARALVQGKTERFTSAQKLQNSGSGILKTKRPLEKGAKGQKGQMVPLKGTPPANKAPLLKGLTVGPHKSTRQVQSIARGPGKSAAESNIKAGLRNGFAGKNSKLPGSSLLNKGSKSRTLGEASEGFPRKRSKLPGSNLLSKREALVSKGGVLGGLSKGFLGKSSKLSSISSGYKEGVFGGLSKGLSRKMSKLPGSSLLNKRGVLGGLSKVTPLGMPLPGMGDKQRVIAPSAPPSMEGFLVTALGPTAVGTGLALKAQSLPLPTFGSPEVTGLPLSQRTTGGISRGLSSVKGINSAPGAKVVSDSSSVHNSASNPNTLGDSSQEIQALNSAGSEDSFTGETSGSGVSDFGDTVSNDVSTNVSGDDFSGSDVDTGANRGAGDQSNDGADMSSGEDSTSSSGGEDAGDSGMDTGANDTGDSAQSNDGGDMSGGEDSASSSKENTIASSEEGSESQEDISASSDNPSSEEISVQGSDAEVTLEEPTFSPEVEVGDSEEETFNLDE